MREFKLIKTYPGSQVLGTVVKLLNKEEVYKEVTSCTSDNYMLYSSSHIEENPEFWQEVYKVAYEIIMVRTSNQHPTRHTPYNTEWDTCNKDFKFWDIHEVKRLSDGQIFTVGDKAKSIGSNNYVHTIKALTVSQKNIHLSREKDGIDRIYVKWDNDEGGNWLDNIEKNVILFTTQDNVEIKNGDAFYAVMNSNYKRCRAVAPGFTNNPEKYTRFAFKENANKFIIYNKPVLSIADIDFCIYGSHEESIEVLEKIVEKRLEL
jgi:hypothetical protein